MKLVGNIKDYYDGAATQFGYSDDVIYNRLCEVIQFYGYGTDMLKQIVQHSPLINKLVKCDITIGFCGKLYYGFVDSRLFENPVVLFPYLQKDVDAFIKLYEEKKKQLRKYETPSWSYASFAKSVGYVKTSSLDSINGDYEECLDAVDNHTIFQDLGCPTFAYYEHFFFKKGGHLFGTSIPSDRYRTRTDDKGCPLPTRWLIKNPILKDFDFGKLIDPYTASQEIEMYLGRLATNNTPPMPVGSDKVIAESKGFDKYSFRKLPSK